MLGDKISRFFGRTSERIVEKSKTMSPLESELLDESWAKYRSLVSAHPEFENFSYGDLLLGDNPYFDEYRDTKMKAMQDRLNRRPLRCGLYHRNISAYEKLRKLALILHPLVIKYHNKLTLDGKKHPLGSLTDSLGEHIKNLIAIKFTLDIN